LFASPFLFTHPPPTATYTLSLHDALPICPADRGNPGSRPVPGADRVDDDVPEGFRPVQEGVPQCLAVGVGPQRGTAPVGGVGVGDRKSTRLNSSHVKISYAVFCLKKKKEK